MAKQVPLVNYLVIDGGEPHLIANTCTECGARWLDRRVACGHCGGTTFEVRKLSNFGTLRAFSIVYRAAPGVPAPFVSCIVDLEGGGVVKANLVDVEAQPEAVKLGMPVALKTYVAGIDDEGTEAVGFGYAPI